MLTFHDVMAAAPDPKPQGDRPAIKRIFSGDGVNLIVAVFLPGQCLPDHTAAHPITVQTVSGQLSFTCGDEKATLTPGSLVHVPAYEQHRVDYDDPSGDPVVMMISMFPMAK